MKTIVLRVSGKTKKTVTFLGSSEAFHCDLCPKSYSSRYYLKQHRQSHHLAALDAVPCFCCACQVLVRDEDAIKAHLRRHPKARRAVKCLLCDKLFNRFPPLAAHRSRHKRLRITLRDVQLPPEESHDDKEDDEDVDDPGPHFCDSCDERFPRRDLLRLHRRMHERRDFRCVVCKRTFATARCLLLHRNVHINKPFPCPHCTKKFPHEDLLRSHVATSHASIPAPTTTGGCGRTYSRAAKKIKEDVAPIVHLCEKCDASFDSEEVLVAHVRLMHLATPASSVDEFSLLFGYRRRCPLCEVVCYSRLEFLRHKWRIHRRRKTSRFFGGSHASHSRFASKASQPQRRFTCGLCSKRFRHRRVYAGHLARHETDDFIDLEVFSDLLPDGGGPWYPHEEDGRLRCDPCGRSYESEAAYSSHRCRPRLAGGSGPCACQVCGRVFANVRGLANHRSAHERGTYFCVDCKLTFNQRSSLLIHRAEMHSGPRQESLFPH